MLEELFCPNAVAVVGVGRSEGNVGHDIFDNIRDAGFKGKCYAVNPNASEIHGEVVYPSLSASPVKIDLVVIVIPAIIEVSLN